MLPQGNSGSFQTSLLVIPLISLGPALLADLLCRGQDKRTMCKSEVQSGNFG